jgi:hypothetical protein
MGGDVYIQAQGIDYVRQEKVKIHWDLGMELAQTSGHLRIYDIMSQG